MLILCAIIVPIVAGGAVYFQKSDDRLWREKYVLTMTCFTSVLVLSALMSYYGQDAYLVLQPGSRLSVAFHVDGLTCIFAVMVSVLWPLASLYAFEYMRHEGSEDRFFACYLAAFGVTLGIAFSANIFTLYFFYELLTLITLPLVMHSMDGKARYAGKVYLTYSMSGAALGFISMVFLIQYGGGLFLFGGALNAAGSMDSNIIRLAYVLGFFGFGVKAAVFPGHAWLLRASVAPTPVTALLHAVAVVKAGVFAVIRITWYGYGPDLIRDTWAQDLVAAAAAFTVVYGSAKALHTKHLKRRLAWSTISNLSYVLLGVTTLTTYGLTAALTHMVFHAVLKITLFFGVGAIHTKMHRDFVPDIEGYGKLMPLVFGTFGVAALGLMGVPPLAGFSSKWMLATACLGTGRLAVQVGAAALIASAILTALYMMQILLLAYFPRQSRAISVKIPKMARRDPGIQMTLPLAILTVLSLVLGLGAQQMVQTIELLIFS